jgi:hypothetical protein
MNMNLAVILYELNKGVCEELSSVSCVECDEHFCEECFIFTHKKGSKITPKLRQGQKRKKNHSKVAPRTKKVHLCQIHKEKFLGFCLDCKEFTCFYCSSVDGLHGAHKTKLLKDASQEIKELNEDLLAKLPEAEKSMEMKFSLLKEEKELFTKKLEKFVEKCDSNISILQNSSTDMKTLLYSNADDVNLCISLKAFCLVDHLADQERLIHVKELMNNFEETIGSLFPSFSEGMHLYKFKFDKSQNTIVQNSTFTGNNYYTRANVMSSKPIPGNCLCYFEVQTQNISTCSFFGVIPEGFQGIDQAWLCTCGPKNCGYGIQGDCNYIFDGKNPNKLPINRSKDMLFGVLVDTRNYKISFTFEKKYLTTIDLEKGKKYFPAMMVYTIGSSATVSFPSVEETKKIFKNTSLKI